MNTLSIPAHFDGERILLDEPVDMAPNTRLLVIVLPGSDPERDAWQEVSKQGLARAYGADEEAYPLDLIKEANPDYEGR